MKGFESINFSEQLEAEIDAFISRTSDMDSEDRHWELDRLADRLKRQNQDYIYLFTKIVSKKLDETDPSDKRKRDFLADMHYEADRLLESHLPKLS